MKPIVALVGATYRQALPVKRTIALLLLQIAPATIYLVATSNRTEEFAYQGAIEIGMTTYFALVLPVVAIVIGAGVLGNERRDLTLSFIALRPIPRAMIATGKLVAASAAAFTVNAVGALALGLTHVVRFGSPDLILGLLVGSLLATIAYAAIYVPVGFLTDRAVIIGMAYLLVVENGLVFLLPGLASLSPWRLGVAAFGGLVPDAAAYITEGEAVGSLAISTPRAAITVLIYAAVSIAVTTFLLYKRDLT
jgi:ABC-2 type transport system permease protein